MVSIYIEGYLKAKECEGHIKKALEDIPCESEMN
jgi:hypothetical protein